MLEALREQVIKPIERKQPQTIADLNQVLFEGIFILGSAKQQQEQASHSLSSSSSSSSSMEELLISQVLKNVNTSVVPSPLMLAMVYPFIYDGVLGSGRQRGPADGASSVPVPSCKRLSLVWVDEKSCVFCESASADGNATHISLNDTDVLVDVAKGGMRLTVSEFSQLFGKAIATTTATDYGYGRRVHPMEVDYRRQYHISSSPSSSSSASHHPTETIKVIPDKLLWSYLVRKMLSQCQRTQVPKEKQTEHALLIKFWLAQWTHLNFNQHITNTMASLESGTL
ncbi:hypothetical protein RFI_06869 [Reticulomyxa filosa]|uniref:Uncharacterized protein n=1 Tax=Reticulomyxa filosa TaxID=46433 RepID=X6NY81_RETFI|nr:hypothetical protein RFI_06869 [Reticulomyxa filosa]|eukprot:ETO30252.1 hypothetical protein RFI_06869 [Reticulomyxa filosa]